MNIIAKNIYKVNCYIKNIYKNLKIIRKYKIQF